MNGKMLRDRWHIRAVEVRYHRDGTFFMPVDRFPAALCDPHGYVLLQTPEELARCRQVRMNERLNVRNGIDTIPGYVRMA